MLAETITYDVSRRKTVRLPVALLKSATCVTHSRKSPEAMSQLAITSSDPPLAQRISGFSAGA